MVYVAGCHRHRHRGSKPAFSSSSSPPPPLSLSALIEQENGPKALIIAAWMLRCVVLLSVLRIVTNAVSVSARQYQHHPRLNNLNRLKHFLATANVAMSIVSCGMVLTTMLIVAEWVNEQEDWRCKFNGGASPFLGLLIAACGLGCTAAALDVNVLMSDCEEGHAVEYQHLQVERQHAAGGEEVDLNNLAEDGL
tara:strand:- start:158 stop:739 length:582 start_codon:yes stop_codon:yes gene_type:complete